MDRGSGPPASEAWMHFKDHFSKQAATYAQYRPDYPTELFAYLAEQAPGRALAWDCATGSGQAAKDLANYFECVVATDASAEQIRRAEAHERIRYRVEPAEQSSLELRSVDLITVAVAAHWFDFEQFYTEARRVLKDGGIIAAWAYYRPVISPELDAVIAYFDDEILAGSWPEQLQYLRDHYRTLPFPFEELSPPEFSIRAEWDLDQMLGFINSWSGTRRFEEQHGEHPLQSIWDGFLAAWGGPDAVRSITWPLYLRVGRV